MMDVYRQRVRVRERGMNSNCPAQSSTISWRWMKLFVSFYAMRSLKNIFFYFSFLRILTDLSLGFPLSCVNRQKKEISNFDFFFSLSSSNYNVYVSGQRRLLFSIRSFVVYFPYYSHWVSFQSVIRRANNKNHRLLLFITIFVFANDDGMAHAIRCSLQACAGHNLFIYYWLRVVYGQHWFIGSACLFIIDDWWRIKLTNRVLDGMHRWLHRQIKWKSYWSK